MASEIVSGQRVTRSASVYVHFPYCLSKCPYCDFVSHASRPDEIDSRRYSDAIIEELDRRSASFHDRSIGSIFFGGGTPSLWLPSELGRVLRAIHSTFGTSIETEVTVECNPSSLDESRASALVNVGVNRLSVGAQSFRDDHLRYLGRRHDGNGARQALFAAMRSGIPRISADFIFGLPGQSPDDAQRQAIELSDFGVTHLSCYQLTIEPGTRFGDLARRGSLTLADDGEVAESFLAVDEGLTSRGLRHYEVSNYAREGDQCRHNLGYWRGDEYLGLGCGAVGYARTNAFGDPVTGVRWRNTDSPRDYLQRAASDDTELLDAETLLRERIMLGLRVDSGVDLDDAASELGVVGWTSARSSCAAALVKRGRIVRQGSRIHIPKREWLWTDRIAADLI